ncbi:hypothetical protein FRC04_001090 [Tulasnella sp. 424]|nr:hypothetical protein FRC04_001090 [Tulasnella sp. 424]KAG8969631.1 hypothetical protein FRC05_000996 [Tulasnella sp. 425]
MPDQTDIPNQDLQGCAMGAVAENRGGDYGLHGDIRNRPGVQLQPRETDKSSEPDRHFNQNEALPVHSLPTEIFLQIIHHHMRPYFEDYYQRLISLTEVCSRWCYIIRGSPSLWSQIHLSDSPNVVEIALQRSSSHPLDVVLHRTGQVQREQRPISSLTAALNPHKDRWRSMDVSVPSPWMEDVIDALEEPAPGLERLSLTDEFNMASTREVDFFGGTAPRLTDLALNGVSICWDSEVLHDLTFLDLSWISFPSTTTILNILSHSPRLQTVTIHRCTTGSMANPSSLPIQLIHMTSLQVDLGSLDAIEDFLGHMEPPARCSLTMSLPSDEKVGDPLQRKLLQWVSKWKYPALVPLDGLLLEIDEGDLRVELSTTDRSEPLALAIESSGDSWVDKFRLLLPQLIDALASWTRNVTTLRLRLGYPPSGCRDLSLKQSIIEQVSRLPPVTSLELSGIESSSFLHGLKLGDVSSLFRNIRALSFLKIGDYELRECLEWMCETVQLVKDVPKSSFNDPNHRGPVLKVELRVADLDTFDDAKLLEAAVKTVEGLVGSGNTLVVQGD